MKTEQGFTLVELMITVAIVAILASVALPSYTEYVRRGQVVQATEMLSRAKVVMEQFYANNRTYVGAQFDGVNICSTFSTTESQNFRIQSTSCTATAFTLRAQGRNSMTGFSYFVRETGVKSTTNTAATGWSSSTTCWVMRRGSSC